MKRISDGFDAVAKAIDGWREKRGVSLVGRVSVSLSFLAFR